MDRQGSGSEGSRLHDSCSLPHGLFQASTERARLRAAVYQVFGSQPWGGCCSDKLLEALLEGGERCYLKQQLFWDFQLLDSDHDGYLSAQDAELLLAQVPRVTGEACCDFLRSRRPGVAWSDIEDWVFGAPRMPVDRACPHTGRAYFSEQAPRVQVSMPPYWWGIRRGDEQQLEGGYPRGLAVLQEEKPSGVVAALERKYQVLQRKLCAEMLEAHYGQSLWASLPCNMKEEKISELEMLVDFALREGSILSLSNLPGAQHSVRFGAQAAQRDLTVGPLDPPVTEGTNERALQQLQCKKRAEMAEMGTQRHLVVGSNPEISSRLLHLHTQTELVQQEASFQAALLVLELFTGERFWESGHVTPEDCHRELARLRLTAGHGSEPAWRESKTMPGRSMTQVLLDHLLLQQEKDRTSLVQILFTLGEKREGVHEQVHSREQPRHQEAETRMAGMSPPLEEVVSQVLNLAQKQLQVAHGAKVSWQDCAIAVLVKVQQEQLEELRHALEDLARVSSGRERETCPGLYEKLLSRLQEPPLMSLVQCLRPPSPQQQWVQETLQVDRTAHPARKSSQSDPEAITAEERLWKEEILGSPQKGKEGEDKGLIQMTSADFSARGELEPKWEGPEHHAPKGPEGPDPQQIMHHNAELFKVEGTTQTGADGPQTQTQLLEKSVQPQEFPELLQVPEEFQQDLQNVREIPYSQEGSQEHMEGLVPHHSQKQQETGMKFSQAQRGIQTESEILDFQKEESTVPCGSPGFSEVKDPKAARGGEFGGLQDSSQQQEASQGAVVMGQAISGCQGLLLRKSKSLASLESSAIQTLPPQGLRDPEIPLQTKLQVPHLLAAQQNEMGVLDTQGSSEAQIEMAIVRVDEMREGTDTKPQPSPKGKQESPMIQRKVNSEVFVLHDEGSHKTLHTQGTPVPLPEEWRDSGVEQKTLQAYKDLHEESLTLQGPGTRYSKDPCHKEQNIPEPSQLQGALLKNSKSLQPQELTRTYEYEVPPEIQQEHIYPHAPHSQEWKGAKAQREMKTPKDHNLREGLQYQTFPESEQEIVQTPELLQKELEASKLKQKLQAIEVSSKETQIPSPEAQRTEVHQASMETDSFHAQDKVQRNLVRTQAIQTHNQEESKVLLTHIALARKAKSLDPEDMAQRQVASQLRKLPTTEMPERRRPQDYLQKEVDVPQTERRLMEKLDVPDAPESCLQPRISGREQEVFERVQAQKQMGPEAFKGHESEFLQRDQGTLVFQGSPQDHHHPEEENPRAMLGQKGTELPQPQNLPFCGTLWRKSKSLELRKPPSFHLQELREPEGPSVQSQHPQTDREVLVSQECRKSGDFLCQGQETKTQGPQAEEFPLKEEKALQVQQTAQNGSKFTGPQNVKEIISFSSEERRQTEIHSLQETQLEKPTSPDLRESPLALQCHERTSLEILDVQQATPQKHAAIPQIIRDAETLPLLWSILGQKAKSFELGKTSVLPSPELELSSAQEMPQKEVCVPQSPQGVKGVSMIQLLGQPPVEPETQKSQEIREAKILYPQGLKVPEVPQTQAEEALPLEREYQGMKTSQISPELLLEQSNIVTPGKIKALQPQDMKALGGTSIQKVPQRRPQMLHRQECPQTKVGLPKYSTTFRETKELHLLERKGPENADTQVNVPPKMWFPQPQGTRSPESPPLLWGSLGLKSKSFELRKPHALETQELKESLIVQSQRSQGELGAQKTPECQEGTVISLQELKEAEVTLVQAGKETLKTEVMPSTSPEIPQPQSLQLHGNECLAIPQIQGNDSPSNVVLPHKEGGGPDTSPPLLWTSLETKAKSFELRKPRTFQTQDLRVLESTIFAQKISQLSGSQEKRGPQASQTQFGLIENSEVEQGLQLQEPRGLEALKAQTDPQRSQTTSQSYSVQQQGLKEPQVFQSHGESHSGALQSQPAPERERGFLHHQKRSSPETPPLLWWALELAQQGMQHMELLVSPQPQEFIESPETNLQEKQKEESKSQKPKELMDPMNLCSQELEAPVVEEDIFQDEGMIPTVDLLQSQERRDPKFQQAEDIPPEVESQVTGRAELTQSPTESPQAFEVQAPKKMENALLERSPQIEQDTKETQGSSGEQKTSVPEETMGLESSLLQDNKPQMCYFYKANETAGFLPSGGLVRKSKSLDLMKLRAPKPQELSELESPQVQKEPAHRTKDFSVTSKDLEMKPQKKKGLPSFKSEGKSDLESVKAREPETESHAALSPPPSQNVLELKSESLLVVEQSTWQSQEQQEGIVVQPQESPQMEPENIKLQGSMDPKTVCSQGHCEAGSCELRMEENNHAEAKGILQSHPHTFLVREASWPQVALLRKSKSLELQKLSVPETFLPQELKKSKTLQAPEGTQGCPAVAENQVVESWGKCSSHQEATQIVKSPLQNLGVLKNGAEFPAQKEMDFQMTSTPQKQLGENEPSALDSQEDMHSEAEQVPGQKERDVLQPLGAPQVEQIPLQAMEGLQKNSESFVSLESTDSRYLFPLQVGETPLKVPKTLELMKSPTQVPSASMESKPFLPSWILRRSKSLDLRELQALQPLSLVGDLDSPNWQNLSRLTVSQTQRKLQDELSEPQKIKGPVVLHSKALPVQEHFQKDQMGPQLQEERMYEVEKPEQMMLQPAQNREQMGNNGEILCSQALEDTQVLCSKECADVKALSLQGCPLSAEEPLQIQRCMQTEPELHGLLEPQLLLDPKEERDVQGSPLLSNLLRKSKTLGLELLRRSDVSQVQHLPRPESPQSQVTREPGTQLLQLQGSAEQVSCSIPGISKMDVHQHQELQNIVEGTLESPENLDSRGVVHKVEVDPMKAKKSLQVNQELFQKQGSSPLASPQSSMSQMLPPHEVPQFGIDLLQELGRLHNELESLRHQELTHEENLHRQETQVLSEPEGHGAAKALGSVSLQIVQHQVGRGTESHQPLPTDQRVYEEHETQLGRRAALPSPQKMQEFCQTLGALKKESETSTDLPAPKASEIGLPETSPVISDVMMSPHVLQSQKHVQPKSHCLQETPQIGWESLEDTEKTLERRTRPIKSQEELVGALLVKSQTLEHQELPRMNQEMPCKVLSGMEDLPFQDRELGLQEMISPQESLHRQSQRSQERETRNSVLLLPLNQRGPKAQQVDEHFQGEQETSPVPKSRHIRLFQQEVQTEMGTSEPQQLEERPASQEWKEEGIWSIEGAQQSALSAPLDLNYLEPAAAKGRLEVSSPWRQREEVLQTWKPAVVPMLSPPSPGKCDEELRWEPASLNVGLSREPSMSRAQAANAAGPARPQQPLKEEAQRDGEGITETINVDSKEARTRQPPPPRPPCREKAFIWFSREEKEEALQRLAAIQAEGERRRQRDKERQILRFQERLSIAKHRKSEEDLLGSSPTERWPLPAAHLCQDQGGQKTAVKRHLEKVKRERTYVMQSKRERNTLRFKELLNPLVTHGEESPEPGQIGDA